MKVPGQPLKAVLPIHPAKTYSPAGYCIYCGSTNRLGDEHIIPFGLGGRMIFPKASCTDCSRITSAFEQTCLRTMFGPLRILYNMPTRRKTRRPSTLPLKVKRRPGEDWSTIPVRSTDFPSLVLFPYFTMPDMLSGYITGSAREAVAKKFWIRAASASHGFFTHLDGLIANLGVHAVMPEGKAHVEEFCLMLAKIGHCFSIAEVRHGKFEPLLPDLILRRNLSNRANFIGGLAYDEIASGNLHELSLSNLQKGNPNLISVRIRLLAKMGTPTYYVVTGRRHG